jgi:nitrite reductase (NO-forming)
MATPTLPPRLDERRPVDVAPPASVPTLARRPVRAAAPPPTEPPRPTAEQTPFSPGPLAAGLGVLAVVLMALMVATNFVLAQRASAPAPVAASVQAGKAAQAPAAPVAAAVEVVASEFKFVPSTLELAGPGELTLTLKNAGVVEHDVVVDGAGAVKAAAGATTSGALKFDKPGTYPFYCSIPGHREAGWGGTFGGGGAAAPPPAAAAPPAAGAATTAAPAVQVKPAAPNAKPLPAPRIAPPLDRTAPANVTIDLETREVTARLADGQTYTFWTFGGSVPGPMIRVMQGDTVELTLRNAADSAVTHSIDLHAVTGPGGGAKATQVPPGGSASFTFKALNPGVYVYHCATPMVAHHIASGMYGLIVVEPPGGLPKVDREFYVMQGDLYLQGARAVAGQREVSVEKLLDERPDYVLFNGGVGSLLGDNALKARVGETVRIFFGVGGPNLPSSFHAIGEIFDRVYVEGGRLVNQDVQTTYVPAGGATIVEFKAEVPGALTLVDHSLGRLEKGAAGQIVVEGPENPAVFAVGRAGAAGGAGH